MDEGRIRTALIAFGFAFNDCVAEAEEIIDDVRAEVDGLDVRAALLLRAVSVQATAEDLRADVLRQLDALDRAA